MFHFLSCLIHYNVRISYLKSLGKNILKLDNKDKLLNLLDCKQIVFLIFHYPKISINLELV